MAEPLSFLTKVVHGSANVGTGHDPRGATVTFAACEVPPMILLTSRGGGTLGYDDVHLRPVAVTATSATLAAADDGGTNRVVQYQIVDWKRGRQP